MKKENIEIILEQMESMQDAFNTLDDNCYQIVRCLRNELKQDASLAKETEGEDGN